MATATPYLRGACYDFFLIFETNVTPFPLPFMANPLDACEIGQTGPSYLSRVLGEAPLVGLENFLAARELELRTSESLDSRGAVVIL